MTPEQIRSLGAQLMIAAAVCGGVYAIVADPLRSRANEAEAELAMFVSQHDGAAATLASLPEIDAIYIETQQQAAQYADRSRPACDESEMFSEVMDLASQVEVVIEQITPANQGGSNGTEVQDKNLRPGDTSVRYALSGSGSYEAVAQFLEGLQGGWSYCVIRNCRITPDFTSKNESGSRFSIVIELLGFDASPIVLEASAGEGTP